MAFLEQHPIHVRKKIALGITVGIAVILVGIMVLIYVSRSGRPQKPDAASSFARFYATILDNAQSFFGSDRGTMEK